MRVGFFIDGFNLYRNLIQYAPNCKRLDLRLLCASYLKSDEAIEPIKMKCRTLVLSLLPATITIGIHK